MIINKWRVKSMKFTVLKKTFKLLFDHFLLTDIGLEYAFN